MEAPVKVCEVNVETMGKSNAYWKERLIELLDFEGHSRMTLGSPNEEVCRGI